MKTPRIYSENLKQGIITEDMLADCLYSVNKRAKNYRDKAWQYRQMSRAYRHYDKYNYVEKAISKKEEYYKQKDKLLSLLTPVCIHKELVGYERQRIYDYQKEYRKYAKGNAFCYENCYFDHERGHEVWFGDIELKDQPRYHYYRFYQMSGGRSFHSPIEEVSVSGSGLEVRNINGLQTTGTEITELISNQFVCKVLALIDSRQFTLLPAK